MTERVPQSNLPGTESVPAASDSLETMFPKPEVIKEVTPSELAGLWSDRTDHLSMDYHSPKDPERVAQAAVAVKSWTVNEFYSYLSQPNIWKDPALFRAVIEEVAIRVHSNNFSQRD